MGDLPFYALIALCVVVASVACWYSKKIQAECSSILDDMHRQLEIAKAGSERLKHLEGVGVELVRRNNIIQAKEVEMNGMMERIRNSDRRCEELSQEVAGLKDRLAQVQSANKNLRLDLDASRESCGNVLDKLNKAQAELEALRKDKEQARVAISKAEGLVERWQKDCVYYRQVFDNTEKKYKDRIATLEKQLGESSKDERKIKEHIELLGRENALLAKDLATVNNRMSVIRQYAAESDTVLEEGGGRESQPPHPSLTDTFTSPFMSTKDSASHTPSLQSTPSS